MKRIENSLRKIPLEVVCMFILYGTSINGIQIMVELTTFTCSTTAILIAIKNGRCIASDKAPVISISVCTSVAAIIIMIVCDDRQN